MVLGYASSPFHHIFTVYIQTFHNRFWELTRSSSKLQTRFLRNVRAMSFLFRDSTLILISLLILNASDSDIVLHHMDLPIMLGPRSSPTLASSTKTCTLRQAWPPAHGLQSKSEVLVSSTGSMTTMQCGNKHLGRTEWSARESESQICYFFQLLVGWSFSAFFFLAKYLVVYLVLHIQILYLHWYLCLVYHDINIFM